MSAAALTWIYDIFIVLILGFSLFLGGKIGLFKIMYVRFRKLLALLLSILLSKPLGKLLADAWVTGGIAKSISEGIGGDQLLSEGTKEELLEQIPGFLKVVANIMNYDLDAIAEKAVEAGENMLYVIVYDLVEPLTRGVCVVLSATALFVVALVLMWVFKDVLDSIFDIPVIKQINCFLGCILGVFVGLIGVLVLVKLSGWIFSWDSVQASQTIKDFSFDNCRIAKYFYHFDLIYFLLSLKFIPE